MQLMKLRKIVGLTLMFVAGCSTNPPAAANEPVYQNRRLSEWLRDFDDRSQPQNQILAADAIRHIGTAALPFLLDQLTADKAQRFQAEMKQWREKSMTANYAVPRPPDPRSEALAGLDALGPLASPALPALEKILREKDQPDLRALYVVARIGPAGVPLLNQMRTNEAKAIRLGASACLQMMSSHSEVLYPRIPVGPDAPSFNRQICEFNLEIMRAALQEYKAEHPESFSPDQNPYSTPPPVRPK